MIIVKEQLSYVEVTWPEHINDQGILANLRDPNFFIEYVDAQDHCCECYPCAVNPIEGKLYQVHHTQLCNMHFLCLQ